MSASYDAKTVTVSVGQSLVLAIVHAALVAGIVYATMRSEIKANTREAELHRTDFHSHTLDTDRHVNTPLLNYQLSQIRESLRQLQAHHGLPPRLPGSGDRGDRD